MARWALYFILLVLPGGWFSLHSFFAYSIVYSLATTVVYALISPVYPIALTLFYYDQRIRLEGYDIECMMQAAGLDKAAEGKCGSFDSLRFAPVAQDDSVNEEGAA
jgi:predicted membrane metal-binding protein